MKLLFSLFLCFIFIACCIGQNPRGLTKDSITHPKSTLVEPIKMYGPLPDPFLDGQIRNGVKITSQFDAIPLPPSILSFSLNSPTIRLKR